MERVESENLQTYCLVELFSREYLGDSLQYGTNESAKPSETSLVAKIV